jgi:hypothetical protein
LRCSSNSQPNNKKYNEKDVRKGGGCKHGEFLKQKALKIQHENMLDFNAFICKTNFDRIQNSYDSNI